MKAIMVSIRPQWVAKILNGEKTIEIRKTCPEIFKHLKPYEGCSIDVYIYCTKQDANYYIKNKIYNSMINGKVVAKFTLNKVEEIHSYLEPEQWYKTNDTSGSDLMKKSCLTFSKLDDYLMSGRGYAWHIEDLEIFDKPKELNEFYKVGYEEAYDLASLSWDNEEGDYHSSMKYLNEKYQLTRAPQSWCYVEI